MSYHSRTVRLRTTEVVCHFSLLALIVIVIASVKSTFYVANSFGVDSYIVDRGYFYGNGIVACHESRMGRKLANPRSLSGLQIRTLFWRMVVAKEFWRNPLRLFGPKAKPGARTAAGSCAFCAVLRVSVLRFAV